MTTAPVDGTKEAGRGQSAGLSRRGFLGLAAAAGGAVLIPAGVGARPASAAPWYRSSTGTLPVDTVHPATAGFAQADLGTASGALGGWGDATALAFDGNRRSIGVDLGSATPFTAIELIRQGEGGDLFQQLSAGIGVLTGDANPQTGSFAHFALAGTAALDYNRRSVGWDLRGLKVLRRLELHNRGATTRVVESDYTLWVSDDNVTWTPLTGWTFTSEVVDGRLQHSFDGFEVTTRYVKVNFSHTDTTGFDFILDTPATNARAFGSQPPAEPGPVHRIVSRDLSVWTSDDNAAWTRVPEVQIVNVDNSLWLYGLSATARYVKVHMHREDTGAETFLITNIQTGIRVHDIPAEAFVASGGASWTWITPVQVSNPTSETLRDRAVFIPADELDIAGLVAAGRLQADLRDLRFATADGRELHAYAAGEGFYVRIPTIAPSAQLEIRAYSGNPAAGDRVTQDAAALQVEYGQRAITPLNDWGGMGLKVVQLPSGLMMTADQNYNTSPRQITAKFSEDGGRSWGAPENILPPLNGTGIPGGLGGFILDPVTGVLSMFFLAVHIHSGGDYSDPAQNLVETWIAQTTGYDTSGRPIFGPPRHIPLHVVADGREVNWGLSYSNGVRTATGTYLYPVSYMADTVGTFTSNVLRSTDGGATWTQSSHELRIPEAPVGFERGITELAITELHDGRVLVLARQQDMSKHYLVTSVSSDDGVTWSTPTDSDILSSNTAAALFRDESGGHGLTWPGHNAFGQVSYYRNNLTAAYSDDDGESWHGYQDLLAASSISTPGWGAINETRTAVNADSWAAPEGGRVFAWGRPSQPPILMLIDDYEAFVRDSHGALDAPAFRDEGRVSNGSELTAARWWRTTRNGQLDLAEGSRAERRATRLRSSALGPAAASRLFPGVREATIRFGLRVEDLATDLHLALQEGFSAESNARGTALSLKITPAGELLVTRDSTFSPIRGIGHSNNDVDPAVGNLTALGMHQIVAYDFQNRSVGADLASPQQVTGLELIDNDFVGAAGNRVDPALLQVWVSDTNAGDWTQLTGWTGTKTGSTIALSGPPVTTRYIKVTHPYSDGGWTFGNDEQRILRVLPDIASTQVFEPLAVPTTLQDGTWHRFEIRADIPRDQVVVIVDGVERGSYSVLHPAEVLTHLLLIGEAASSGEVRIDEFMVQDTALGLPVLASVGQTYALGTTSPGNGGGDDGNPDDGDDGETGGNDGGGGNGGDNGAGGNGAGGNGSGGNGGSGGTGGQLPGTGVDGAGLGTLTTVAALGAALGGGLLMLRTRGSRKEGESAEGVS